MGDLALADYGTFLASNYKFVFDAATVNYSITQKDITAQVTEPATWISADEVELVAPTGYTISLTNGVTDTFTSSVIVDTEEKEGVVVTYYLREADGAISTAKTFTYGNDQTAPTGEITIGENKFKSFINGITFGMFFKEKVDVTITGEDALSGVDTIEYQKVATEADYSEGGTWITASKFSVEENETFIVYARITDKVGNATIINSDGVVVYTDSEAKTTEIAFTKLGTEDVTAEVTTNGNTILGITNGTYTLTSDDYLVSMESNNVTTITFKASYLDTLTSGDYTFTISYNPLGETYVVIAGNEAPAETTIALTVNKRPLSVVIDNQEIVRGMSIPTFTSTVSGNVNGDVIEVVYSTDADNMTAGTYEIFMANTDDYPNYDIDVTPGILTVTNGYTVSFDGEEITDIAHGETVAEPENPTKDGYIFLGWYAGDEEFDFTTAITGDLELTSAWEEVVEKEDDTDVEDDPDVEDDTDVEDDDIVDTSDTNNVTFTFSVMLISLLAIALLSKKKFEVK